ncbi:hypothetical protein CLTHE_10020 [Clostridium thermobutyricum DSM 4928]|uniref:YetF C-terminal domain-containing protein n=2 Tax=Clostridium thermobutyricum TaxID=29372 RepID=A0A1V4SWL5_9CLOT|nr:hypothetical protein CLTHE_10020 [Clostridium thermobutyricum DSM 4928]
MLILLARTVILYFLVILVMRLMGKRQIGELQPYEFVITIMISDLALLPMQDVKLPLLLGIVPILTLLLLKLGLSQLQLKSQFARKIIDGEPTILIYNSKIQYKNLKNQQINLDELMEELRLAGYFDLEEIQYAILENNGDISILPNQAQSSQGSGSSQNSGSQSSGNQASSSQNSSNQASGSQNSSTQASETQNSSNQASGSQNSSNQASDSQNSSTQASGTQNSSNQTSGSQDSGTQASDSQNSSNQASGSQNSSNQTSSSQNSGTKGSRYKKPKTKKSKSKKTGTKNTKPQNSGSQSSSSQSSSSQNTGSQTMSENSNSNKLLLPKILVCDGKINKNSLTKVNHDTEWVTNKLKEYGIDDMKKVLIAFFDTQGNFKYQLFDNYTKENTQNEK